MPEWMEKRQRTVGADAVELSADEGDSFALFASLDTQWQRHAMTGHRIALDYGRIEPSARMMGIEMTPQRFLDLRHMEAAALAEFAKMAKR